MISEISGGKESSNMGVTGKFCSVCLVETLPVERYGDSSSGILGRIFSVVMVSRCPDLVPVEIINSLGGPPNFRLLLEHLSPKGQVI
jgi:hypothetical protein